MPDDEVPESNPSLETLPETRAAHQVDPIPLTAISRQDRIASIDVLRGLAVLGIFLINMPLYVGPSIAFFNWENNPYWTSHPDRLATAFIYIFAQGKFYTLFSFLFGVGFGMQMLRATERNAPDFLSSYRRRLLTLLGIGTLHFFLVWWGDVLHVYALLGFLLLPFRERSNRTLLIWVACLTFIPLLLAIGGTTFEHITRKDLSPDEKKEEAKRKDKRAKDLIEDVRIYSSGAISEILTHRSQRNLRQLATEAGWSMELFGNFLLGLWVSRKRILQDPQRHRPLLKKIVYIALPVALLVTAADVFYGFQHPGVDSPLWRVHLGFVREFLGRPFVAFGYVSLLLLIGIQSWMTPFAAVGRMALSNYLLQSLTFTTIANSYGWGLYGKVEPVKGLQWCFAFYTLQLIWSVLWLKVFQQGPAEWLWRRLTYRSYKVAN